jgi:hypothetical protein
LGEEHRLRVFENRVLRKIFGPKREEDGSWRKLHNNEFHSLYSSLNIVRVIKARRIRWAGHVAHMGDGRGVYRVLVGRPKGERPLGRPRCMWEDNTISFILYGIRRNCHSSGRNLLLYQFIKRLIRLIIIEESPSYQLPTKFYPTFFWPVYLLMSMTLLETISVGSVIIDLLPIRFSTSPDTREEMGV